jgi:predicted Zn-dependent protease with MMP-like domain
VKFARLAEIAVETVTATQRRLPAALRPLAEAVPVHYEALPHESVIEEGFEPDILGLFTGQPHGTEFSQEQPAPPEILLYLENLWDMAEGDEDTYREDVRVTYLHELGHYFGWDEDQLTARGLE